MKTIQSISRQVKISIVDDYAIVLVNSDIVYEQPREAEHSQRGEDNIL